MLSEAFDVDFADIAAEQLADAHVSNLVLRVVMSRSLKARATARLLATARVLPWIFHSSSDNPSQTRISSMQAEGELL